MTTTGRIVRNSFGILSPDTKSLSDGGLLNFLAPGQAGKAEVLIVSCAYRELPEKDFKEKFLPFVAAAELAFELFEDKERARLWMVTPNQYFFDLSPFQVAMRGYGELVSELLLKWLGWALEN